MNNTVKDFLGGLMKLENLDRNEIANALWELVDEKDEENKEALYLLINEIWQNKPVRIIKCINNELPPYRCDKSEIIYVNKKSS